MHCIYLDQFAVSNICDEIPDSKWKGISELIRRGVELKRIICPTSIEHLVETSGKKLESASKHDKEFQKFSFGWSFYPEPEITAYHIICRLRKIKKTKHHYVRKAKGKSLSEKNVHSSFRELKDVFGEMINDVTIPLNTIRKASRGAPKGDKASRDALVKIIKKKQSDHLIERMTSLSQLGKYEPKPVLLAGYSIPFWADTLCAVLTRKHKLTKSEALQLKRILEAEGIDSIPSISIRASLEAMLAHKQANESPNDHLDIMRIAGALPFADIMLVDGPKASDIRELGLDKKFGTAIYSGKIKDLDKLKNHLSRINSGQPINSGDGKGRGGADAASSLARA